MAHIVQIPVSFEFRIRRVRWVEVKGRIVGANLLHSLARLRNGCVFPVDPGKDLSGAPTLTAEVFLDNEKIPVEVAWPYMPYERGELYARYDQFIQSPDLDIAARRIFSDYRPEFFFAREEDGDSLDDDDGDSLDDDEDYFRTCTQPAHAW